MGPTAVVVQAAARNLHKCLLLGHLLFGRLVRPLTRQSPRSRAIPKALHTIMHVQCSIDDLTNQAYHAPRYTMIAMCCASPFCSSTGMPLHHLIACEPPANARVLVQLTAGRVAAAMRCQHSSRPGRVPAGDCPTGHQLHFLLFL